MDYITVREAAQKWNISDRLVQKYCAEGRIEGVQKFPSLGFSTIIFGSNLMPVVSVTSIFAGFFYFQKT